MIENVFEFTVVLMALFYTNFAKLPLMVGVNIFLFECLRRFIEWNWHVSVTPGYEIYFSVTGAYFAIMAAIFFVVRNHFFKVISAGLFIQALVSCATLFSDIFETWHEFINDGMLLVECILVCLCAWESRNEARNR